MIFRKGTPLRQSSPYLRNRAQRLQRILDVTERNSVIEGLPRFTKQRRELLLRKLKTA